MDIKGFKTKDGTVYQYDYGALANKPQEEETPSQGSDGGYYTPGVTQPEKNKVQFDFTPSKSDMPAVAPVQVELPVGPDSGGNVDLTGVVKSVNGKTPDAKGNVQIDVVGSDENIADLKKQIVIEAVRQNNATKNAMRIATYNIYGAGYYQLNWPALKEQLYKYGLDICAMQEVKDPLGINDGNAKFAEEMTSTMLPYASTNGELYPTNTRSALSRYPILSSSEFQFEKWSNDKRYLAKYEIALPKFKNRIGSDNLKMSVYNTQLDFNWENIVQYEVQEMLAAIAQDPNPFIVICIDSNDASEEKQVWQTIEAAGFTRCVNVSSKTVKYDSICLDNIFVNENMKALFYDVIDSNSYTFSAAQFHDAPISDHSLCYADVELLYDNIWCVKEVLTHVTSDIASHHIKRGEPFTAKYIVDEGYEVYSVTVWMIDENFKIQDEVWDASAGTISIPEVTNDIYVNIVAQRIANTGDYGLAIPSGYTGTLDTGKKAGTVEMTVDVPTWDEQTSFSLFTISYQAIKANTDNTWTVAVTPSATVDVDVTPSDLVGAGKKTVKFSNFTGFNNSTIVLNPNIAMTIYEFKHYNNSGTLDLHLMATDVPGIMKDVLTDKNYQFTVDTGVEDEGNGGNEGDDSVACTGITLSENALALKPAETKSLNATVTPNGCTDTVTWESDNTGVATVSGGVVAAVSSGSAMITAKCGKYSASCAVTVSDETGGGEDSGDTPTYCLRIPEGYTGTLATNIRKGGTCEITVDIPSWGNMTTFNLVSCGTTIVTGKSDNTWINAVGLAVLNNVVQNDMTPNDLVGYGKQTVVMDMSSFDNSFVNILANNRAQPEMTIYEYKHIKNGALVLHLVPTATPGVMKDVLTDTEYTFSVTDGLTVVTE